MGCHVGQADVACDAIGILITEIYLEVIARHHDGLIIGNRCGYHGEKEVLGVGAHAFIEGGNEDDLRIRSTKDGPGNHAVCGDEVGM